MYANNEIGTIEPIVGIGRELLKWRKQQNSVYPYFHTDACQAAAYLDLAVNRLHVDLMTLNGSKIYGPKGSGVLYKARSVVIEPLVYGGGQEMRYRSGTENAAAIIGFARALELVQKEQKQSTKKQRELQQYFWRELHKQIPDVILNGPPITKDTVDRLLNNINITIQGVEAEAVILYLDTYGIECSAGSACTANDDDVSHVLMACGVNREKAKQTIRLTMGKHTTKKDIEYVLKYIKGVIKGARAVREFELSTDVAPN
jgi:cysteine desulfurase